MAITKRVAAFAGAVGAFLMINSTAFAQSISLPNPLGSQTIAAVLQNVITFLQYIGAPIAVIMVLVGAFQMITSAGNPEQYGKGRETLIWAAVGFAIVLLAGGIATLISNILNGQ